MTENEKITKLSLYNHVLNGNNSNDNTLEIVSILGGIDMILMDYLSDSDHKMNRLNENKLNEINQLFKSPKKCHPLTRVDNINKNKKKEIDDICIYHELNENDNFLHYIFGKEKAKKISNIFHSKSMYIMIILSFMIWGISYIISRIVSGSLFLIIQTIRPIYKICVSCLLWIPFQIFYILSLNRVAFNLCIKTFEFWFKTIYAIIFNILLLIYWHNRGSNSLSNGITGYTNNALEMVMIIMITIIISSFDAINIGKIWTFLLSIGMAFIFFSVSIRFQFLEPDYKDYTIFISTTESTLSFASMISSTARILGIFFLKQAYFSYIREGRAVIIKYNPLLIWSSNSNHDVGIKEQLSINMDINENYKREMKEIVIDELVVNKRYSRDTDDSSSSSSSTNHSQHNDNIDIENHDNI